MRKGIGETIAQTGRTPDSILDTIDGILFLPERSRVRSNLEVDFQISCRTCGSHWLRTDPYEFQEASLGEEGNKSRQRRSFS